MIPEFPAKKKSKRFIIPAGFYAGKKVEEKLDNTTVPKQNIVNKVLPTISDEQKASKVKEKIVVTVPPLGNRQRSILSLKSITDKKISSKKKEVAINYDNLPKTPFAKEDFAKLWKLNIVKLNQKNEKLLGSLLSSITFELKYDFKIELTLPNARMQQEIDKAKGKVLHFFRKELNNYGIDFLYKINEKEEKKFAYTPQEKYEFLKEKNPLLSLLRKTLDLEV